MEKPLKFPAPYFGGKSRIASEVWARLGDVDNFIEPFAGSAAVLLARPTPPKVETINEPCGDAPNAWRAVHQQHGDPVAVADHVCEILNDLSPHIVNVWRSLQGNPQLVAEWADEPVSEATLHAIHKWLVRGNGAANFLERIRSDPDYFDPKRAGRWLFGACCWIGSGWCELVDSRQIPKLEGFASGCVPEASGSIDWQQRPQLEDSGGRGVLGHSSGKGLALKVPRLTNDVTMISGGRSEWQQLPDLSNSPIECRGRPQLADAFSRGRGVNGNDRAETCRDRREWLLDWFKRLQDRLRTVRVCCGHWKRVCDSDSVTTRLGVSGIFLDPPYPTHDAEGAESRDGTIYATDGDRDELDKLRDEVLDYCRERGGDPRMRICVAGYDTDGYAALEALGWTVLAWKSNGGYANRGGGEENENRGRERLWFSPHCVDVESQRRPLFAGMD